MSHQILLAHREDRMWSCLIGYYRPTLSIRKVEKDVAPTEVGQNRQGLTYAIEKTRLDLREICCCSLYGKYSLRPTRSLDEAHWPRRRTLQLTASVPRQHYLNSIAYLSPRRNLALHLSGGQTIA